MTVKSKVQVKACLQSKKGLWYIRLYWYEYESGKRCRKQTWISTQLPIKGNKRNAENLLKQYVQEKENDLSTGRSVVENGNIMLSAFMLNWLAFRKSDKKHPIRTDTFEGYQRNVKLHINPYFDHAQMTLRDIEPEDLDEFYEFLLDSGLSISTVRKIHSNLNYALKRAVKMKIIYSNPADYIETLPSAGKPVINPYNEKELQELFRIAKGDPLEATIKLTAFYGFRRSEVLGIMWSAIDFEKKTIRVAHTAILTSAGVEYSDRVKSKKSYRELTIPDDMLVFLKELKARQLEEKAICGNSYDDNDYVCKWPDGKRFAPSYVSHHFSSLLEKNGLRHIRFHDLRHSAASYLLSHGMTLQDVKEWLGHSTIAITADIYGHLTDERKKAIGDEMNKGLGGMLHG